MAQSNASLVRGISSKSSRLPGKVAAASPLWMHVGCSRWAEACEACEAWISRNVGGSLGSLVATGYQGPDLGKGNMDIAGCLSWRSSHSQVISWVAPKRCKI